MQGITFGEAAITELMVMVIEDNWDSNTLRNFMEVNDAVAVGFIIILDSEPALYAVRHPLEVVTPAIHRLFFLAKCAAKVDVDLRSRGVRHAHDIHDLAVNAQVANTVEDNMLTWGCQAVELSGMEAEALAAIAGKLTSAL